MPYHRNGNTKHGMWYSVEYKAYYAMLNRCLNPNYHAFNRYGGRGIKVCPRWRTSFMSFFVDMGYRPANTSLDRKNNDANYTPDNCRWATKQQQQNNKSRTTKLSRDDVIRVKALIAKGVSYKKIGDQFGVSAATICHLNKGKTREYL